MREFSACVERRKDIDPHLRQPQDAADGKRDDQHEGYDDPPNSKDDWIPGPHCFGPIRGRVDLQPHRTHYGRTFRLDARFKDRASKILGCYANAGRFEAAW